MPYFTHKKPQFLLQLLLTGLAIAHLPAQAAGEHVWAAGEISSLMGPARQADGALVVTADAQGRIMLAVEAKGLELDDNPVVEIDFAQLPEPARMAMAWKVESSPQTLHQYQLPQPRAAMRANLQDHPQWQGTVLWMGVGISVLPSSELAIRSVAIRPQTALDIVASWLDAWSSFSHWNLTSFNGYTGTHPGAAGKEPLIYFVALMALLLLGYCAVLLARNRIDRFNWHVAALIAFFCWLGLDLMWQTRLLHQLDQTLATFAGKSSQQKLLASPDRAMVTLANEVKERIDAKDARLFLVSDNDYGAMLAAYYLAPINAYWDRRSQTLPATDYLSPGDYILLIPPHSVTYRGGAAVIRTADDKNISVRELLNTQQGLLLRVI